MNNYDLNNDAPPPPPVLQRQLAREIPRALDQQPLAREAEEARLDERDRQYAAQQLEIRQRIQNNAPQGGKRHRRRHSRSRKYSKRGGTADPMEVEDVEMEIDLPPVPPAPRLVRQHARIMNDDDNIIPQQPIREDANRNIERQRLFDDAMNVAAGQQMGGRRRTRRRKNRSRRNRKTRTRRYRKSRR